MTGQRQEGRGHRPGTLGALGAGGGGREPPGASVGSGPHAHFAPGGRQLVLVCGAASGGDAWTPVPPARLPSDLRLWGCPWNHRTWAGIGGPWGCVHSEATLCPGSETQPPPCSQPREYTGHPPQGRGKDGPLEQASAEASGAQSHSGEWPEQN